MKAYPLLYLIFLSVFVVLGVYPFDTGIWLQVGPFVCCCIMDMKNPENFEQLLDIRRRYHNKAFHFLAESAVIFGLPAILAYVFGTKLDHAQDSGKRYVLIFLGVAFIVSWTIVIVRSRRLISQLHEADRNVSVLRKGRATGGLWKAIEGKDPAVSSSNMVYNKPASWKRPDKNKK